MNKRSSNNSRYYTRKYEHPYGIKVSVLARKVTKSGIEDMKHLYDITTNGQYLKIKRRDKLKKYPSIFKNLHGMDPIKYIFKHIIF